MVLRAFYNEIKGTRVVDLPANLKPSFAFLKKCYRAKYIDTNSIDPLFHYVYANMLIGYLWRLPGFRRRFEEEKAEAAARRLTGAPPPPFKVSLFD